MEAALTIYISLKAHILKHLGLQIKTYCLAQNHLIYFNPAAKIHSRQKESEAKIFFLEDRAMVELLQIWH